MSLPPKAFSPAEVQHYISTFPKRKAPGSDLITFKIAKNLPKKTIILLTYIFNATLRLTYFPLQWKSSIIILIPKPGKPPESPSSYRPISLLPFFSKVLEKLILKRINPIINNSETIPNTQFGFRNQHSTIHQINRSTDSIASALEKKQYCTAAFLDVAQAFDRVWHDGLLYKLKKILPPTFYLFFKSYLHERQFAVRYRSSLSDQSEIQAGVPQGAIAAPLLFNIFIADQPTSTNTLVAEYADDKAIISTHENPLIASNMLQNHLTQIESWCKNWKIKINESKSCHITFTLKQGLCPQITFNNIQILTSLTTKYLVNSNYEFIYVDVGKNGRLSDGGVFEYTEFGRKLLAKKLNLPDTNATVNNMNYVFIGDEAFSLEENFLKPYAQKDLNSEKRIFNYRLSRARNVVENAFGIISSRFRILHTPINMQLKNISYVILAICVLHNFLRRRCNAYISPITVDSEDTDGCEKHQGDWRNNAVELVGLQPVNSRTATIRAKINRDNYKEFFNTEGRVEWQDAMIRAGRA
ncbi:hypothetical protein QTP88_025070 [Uroleucon formosanum]